MAYMMNEIELSTTIEKLTQELRRSILVLLFLRGQVDSVEIEKLGAKQADRIGPTLDHTG